MKTFCMVLQKPRLLVHLHLFYTDQLPYFLQKLKNITRCKWDLIVTLTQTNPSVEKELKTFKPNVKIIQVENKGYDIWPFLQVLSQSDLSQYNYILKLHTKNTRADEARFFEIKSNTTYLWRNMLVDSLLSSERTFLRNLTILEKNPKIGMLACAPCIVKRSITYLEDTSLFENLIKTLHLKTSCRFFCAGTMFMIRPQIVTKLLNAHFTEKDFSTSVSHTGGTATLAHAIERVFIPLFYDCKMHVYPLQNFTYTFKHFLYLLFHHFFSITNENKQKVLWLLWMKIPLSKKPLS